MNARRRVPLFTIFAVLAVSRVVSGQTQQTITSCPGWRAPITIDTSLGSNLMATETPCLVFGADNITLSLNGFTIDMRSIAPPWTAQAIDTNGRRNVRVKGSGDVLTRQGLEDYGGVIRVRGGTGIEVQRVVVRNVDLNGDCVDESARLGTGIVVAGASGVTVEDSVVECYAKGIWLIDSNNDSGAPGWLRRNKIRNNNSALSGLTFGIFLDGASNWRVMDNLLSGNGDAGSPSQSALQIGALLGGSGSSNNLLLGNTVDNNVGIGITIFDFAYLPASFISTGNFVVNNHVIGNSTDLADFSRGANQWLRNNVCNTQTGLVPPGVCSPGEI